MENHYTVALHDVCEAFSAFEPPQAKSVSEGVAKSLIIRPTGAPSGPWDASETPYMVEPMDMLASRFHEAEVFVGPARTGKCLDLDTLIPTTIGWTTMRDVRVGDMLISDTGIPTKIEIVHPVLYDLPCYEVTFSDGTSVVTDSEHLWTVERFYWKTPNWRTEVRTTESMVADLLYSPRENGHARFRYRVRNTRPIELPEKHLLIDPYILGVWLGNGSTGQATITSHKDDVSHYENAIVQAGHTVKSGKDGDNTEYTRIDRVVDGNDDPMGSLNRRLRCLRLLGDKHIPPEYLRGSFDQRLALLQGLMDTDGYPGNDTHPAVEFSTIHAHLAAQVCELVRSLGLKPIAKEKESTWVYNGERKFGVAWRVTFSTTPDFDVFTLPRKRDKARASSIDIAFRQIVSIAPVASRPVRCIKVDAPSSLFLAGTGMVPTHNTLALLVGWMVHTVINDPGDILFIQMTQDKAREFSKTDISRAIDSSPDMRAMLGASASDRNTHDVMFKNGVWLRIAWPTVSNVSGSTYRYVAITDLDRIANAEDVDGEGPLFSLGLKRTATFLSRGMCLAESSPGIDVSDPNWKAATPHEAPPVTGILGIYNRSDRRRWYWNCPDCCEWFEAAPGLSLFNLPSDETLTGLVRTADLAAMAAKYGSRVICPCCGVEIPAKSKTLLNKHGRWVADGQTIDIHGAVQGDAPTSKIVGYWLGGVAATYQSWESLIYRYLQGLRDYVLTGSEKSLQTTVNTDQGMPYTSRHLLEANAGRSLPQDRAEPDLPRYIVPPETRCVVISTDVQGGTGARFEVQVHAVGPHMEQWLVDRFPIKLSMRAGMGGDFAPIDPAGYAEDWDVLTEKLLRATWKTPDESREIRAKLLVIDTGGEGKGNGGEGVTHNAYAWYRRIRKLGYGSRVMLYKGGSNPADPIIKETLVGRRGTNAKGDVPLFICNPNLLSDEVHSGLIRQGAGPNYIHFPAPHHPTRNPNGWLPPAFFDELQAEVRDANGTWRKVRKRNESFDLCRMVRAGMLRLGLDKIQDWSVVPAWLAPLSQNSEIVLRETRRALQDNTLVAQPPQLRVVGPVRRQRRFAQATF